MAQDYSLIFQLCSPCKLPTLTQVLLNGLRGKMEEHTLDTVVTSQPQNLSLHPFVVNHTNDGTSHASQNRVGIWFTKSRRLSSWPLAAESVSYFGPRVS